MKRYFEFVGQKQVVEVNIRDGSPASKSTVQDFIYHYKQDMRELDKEKYEKLKKEFSEQFTI